MSVWGRSLSGTVVISEGFWVAAGLSGLVDALIYSLSPEHKPMYITHPQDSAATLTGSFCEESVGKLNVGGKGGIA